MSFWGEPDRTVESFEATITYSDGTSINFESGPAMKVDFDVTYDYDKERLFPESLSYITHSSRVATISLTIDHPMLYGYPNPYLYKVHAIDKENTNE